MGKKKKKKTFKGKALFILYVMIEMLSLRLKNITRTHYGYAKRSVKLSLFVWIIFILDLALSYTVGVPMGISRLLLLPFYFYFAMKEISCCLFLGIKMLKLSNILIQRLDIWMIY